MTSYLVTSQCGSGGVWCVGSGRFYTGGDFPLLSSPRLSSPFPLISSLLSSRLVSSLLSSRLVSSRLVSSPLPLFLFFSSSLLLFFSSLLFVSVSCWLCMYRILGAGTKISLKSAYVVIREVQLPMAPDYRSQIQYYLVGMLYSKNVSNCTNNQNK